MNGVKAAARLLQEAQALLQEVGAYGAVDVLGSMRLQAELRCPTGPETAMNETDQAALAALETAGAAA